MNFEKQSLRIWNNRSRSAKISDDELDNFIPVYRNKHALLYNHLRYSNSIGKSFIGSV